MLAKNANDTLVISECRKNDAFDMDNLKNFSSAIDEHFYLRYQAENNFFPDSDFFTARTLPILHGEVNSTYVYDIVKRFGPELMFVFGASIIKEPLISLLSPGHFINLHLGLSPYYRGSGTNFWPFVNEELEYVGSTILHLDAGVDTGDIIAHVRPEIETGDNVHTVGCKVIKASALALVRVMKMVKEGKSLNRVKQWHLANAKYYRKKDFNKEVLLSYKDSLANGLVEGYLKNPNKYLKLVSL